MEYEIPMIPYKGRGDTPNIGSEINENSGERSKLNYRHSRGRHFRIAVVQIRKPACEYKMRGRTNRYELGQSLDNTENDRLQQVHYSLGRNRREVRLFSHKMPIYHRIGRVAIRGISPDSQSDRRAIPA